jgi:hypothetical protein
VWIYKIYTATSSTHHLVAIASLMAQPPTVAAPLGQ